MVTCTWATGQQRLLWTINHVVCLRAASSMGSYFGENICSGQMWEKWFSHPVWVVSWITHEMFVTLKHKHFRSQTFVFVFTHHTHTNMAATLFFHTDLFWSSAAVWLLERETYHFLLKVIYLFNSWQWRERWTCGTRDRVGRVGTLRSCGDRRSLMMSLTVCCFWMSLLSTFLLSRKCQFILKQPTCDSWHN